MNLEPKLQLRLQSLTRVEQKECKHLASTDSRLIAAADAMPTEFENKWKND